ncbi:MAG: hypothetical protein H6557_12225 [Lewinellaceae bacterium]|nr:hypothetical protein [Phaeodactylibacter sp.]MCB9037375.1 hypothetical protein [Lewinellaceae bacterium]
MKRYTYHFLTVFLPALFFTGVIHAQAFPPDLEIVGISGSLAPDGQTYVLQIQSNGDGLYAKYRSSEPVAPPEETSTFNLSNAELESIWQSIVNNDFFNLNTFTTNPDIEDRTFASLTIRGNGQEYEVTTENIAYLPFDNIIGVINSITPTGNQLIYDNSPLTAFTTRDVCDTAPGFLFSSPPPPSDKFSNTGEPLTFAGNYSMSASSTNSEVHAGTTVAYRISLQEAVNRGIATLEGKGGFYGDQVSITIDNSANQTGNDLELTLYLEFWGAEANSANAQTVKSNIENIWSSNTTSNGQTLNAKVETRLSTTATSPPGTHGFHQIELKDIETSFVSSLGSINSGVSSGSWDPMGTQANKVHAHEAGHLFGLEDRYEDYRKQMDGTWEKVKGANNIGTIYTSAQLSVLLDPKYPNHTAADLEAWLNQASNKRVTAPQDGSEGDLMAELSGSVQQSDIDAIAAQAGLVVEIRPGDILINKNGNEQNFAITRSVDMFIPAGQQKTLDGLWVACIDAHKSIPRLGALFDYGPPLDIWVGNQAAPLLLQLLQFVDEQELFCSFNFETQRAIWRLSDNDYIGNTGVENLLQDAGINIGNQMLNFPRMTNPNAGNPITSLVIPPQVAVGSSVNGIPTMTEWGIFLFILLICILGLVTIYNVRFSMQASAGLTIPGPHFRMPFDKGLLRKVLPHALWLSVVGVIVILWGWGEIVANDIIGMGLSIPLVAYILHLIFLLDKKNED